MFTYEQKTGKLRNSVRSLVGTGYSGNGIGLNNASFQNVHDVGPLPRGLWTIELIADEHGKPVDHNGKHAPVFRLLPKEGTQTFGRSDFEFHGDLIGHVGENIASKGCVILNHDSRLKILVSSDRELEVI
jgi:hypothetical protein